jgi:hypothetical protein
LETLICLEHLVTASGRLSMNTCQTSAGTIKTAIFGFILLTFGPGQEVYLYYFNLIASFPLDYLTGMSGLQCFEFA